MTEKEIREGFEYLGLSENGMKDGVPISPEETGRLLAEEAEENMRRLDMPWME